MLFHRQADEICAYATLATAVVAIVALTIALYHVMVTKHESRRGVAKSIYMDYPALAFANPKYSSASYPIENPPINEFASDQMEFERYEYFVSYLLFATEEILALTKNDLDWRNTLRDQLKHHAIYLDGSKLPEGHYAEALHGLRKEAINAYNAEKLVAKQLLQRPTLDQ